MTGARSAPPAAALGTVAPAVFVLLWSTGFVGAKYGLPYAEPFTFLLIRLAIAAVLVGVLAAALRAPWPASRAQWRHAAVAGLLLHAGYLGAVFFAIHRGVPAGISAVIVSLQPVLTSALVPRLLGERVGRVQWAGLALGLLGVVLVVLPGTLGGGPGGLPAVGLAACVVGLAATTAGTLYQKRHGAQVPLLAGTAVQYATCAAFFAVLAPLTESMEVTWTGELLAAMAWLVLALSVGAILLLLTLLRRGSASRVSSLFYLVPPATAVEAYLLFGERLGPLELLGMGLAVAGVALVLLRAPRG
ncbi:MAG: Permease of the drug/metabolite transporter (DMT) superfamily [uncultured Solirubrobacteraceae bacterium]|uniref:Permease of the drug/metabolite transporter (DMT) superfamily n=1 Tax=uncultured Solirubrobacteraceae bacterium TaxID=1162706 RepID=A0A6J4SJA6_9ACTN|nr:MAG: Permease of the drug/metabolite transporter (DMT) superfamily [uncultured Solirubrobacteraceae bacterium]